LPHDSLAAADTRIVDAAQLPAPQLGRILVAARLLTEEQLAHALEEQSQTGRRLGEIIVQRGFISGPALANALAEQHGGVLKTEYGFASGLGGDAARRAASEAGGGAVVPQLRPPEPAPIPQLRTAEPVSEREEAPDPAELAVPERVVYEQQAEEPSVVAPAQPEQPPAPVPLLRAAEVAEPETEASPAPSWPAAAEPSTQPEPVSETSALRPPEPELELEAVPTPEPGVAPEPEVAPVPPAAAEPAPQVLRPAVEEASAIEPAAAPAPEADVQPMPDPIQEAPEPEPEPEPEPADAPEPEPEDRPDPEPVAAVTDDRDSLLESLHARLEAQEQELVRLRELLAQERAREEVQVHVWPEEHATPTPEPAAQREHFLLCVPTSAGYVLLDRVGVLPVVGQAVDVPEEEGRFLVTKIVRLPRNGRPCAYLQRA
jgi:hypothetical protein